MDATWGTFALAMAFGSFVLFTPGALFFRALGTPRLFALASAPLFTLPAYCLLCAGYPYLGIDATPLSVTGPVFLATLLGYAVRRIVQARKSSNGTARLAHVHPSWKRPLTWAPLLYVVIGLAVAALAILMPQGTPDALVFSHDNVRHFGQIESFAHSTSWSPFATTLYPEGYGAEFDPFKTTSFYPTAWHVVAVLLVEVLHVSVPLAANVANILFAAVAYPLGMCLLLRTLFPGKPGVVLAGALCTSAFTAFPWTLLGVWELYPYAVSLSLLPSTLTCFIVLIGREIPKRTRLIMGGSVALGVLCDLFTQPSSAFTAAVFLAPLCVFRIMQAVESSARPAAEKRLRKAAGAGGFILGAAVLWIVACNAPFIKDVVAWFWKPVTDVPQAALNAVTLAFAEPMPQVLLSMLVLVGIICALTRRTHLWLVVSYVLACLIFTVSAALPDVPLKHIVSGFWYTDYYRIAAFAAVFAVPFASMGLHRVLGGAWCFFQKRSWSKRARNICGAGSAALVVVLFAAFNFSASYEASDDTYLDTPFARVQGMTRAHCDPGDQNPYGAKKRAFVQQVKEVVPPGEVVINLPHDGSLYAFSADGLNVYQRYISGYGPEGESPESTLIRRSLDDIATNERVQEAVDAIGANYVMILDRNTDDMHRWFYWYKQYLWTGLQNIDDKTPGFEVVLSEGDMRLYRIVC